MSSASALIGAVQGQSNVQDQDLVECPAARSRQLTLGLAEFVEPWQGLWRKLRRSRQWSLRSTLTAGAQRWRPLLPGLAETAADTADQTKAAELCICSRLAHQQVEHLEYKSAGLVPLQLSTSQASQQQAWRRLCRRPLGRADCQAC